MKIKLTSDQKRQPKTIKDFHFENGLQHNNKKKDIEGCALQKLRSLKKGFLETSYLKKS